jgi:methyltransferase (TIGR00027 family)
MTRTKDDTWDLASGVGTTATMVAAARAVASRGPDPVVNDRFAEILVRAVDVKLFTQVVDGLLDFSHLGAGWFPLFFGIRTRAFDAFFTDACRAGIRQAVILASGLDCRAYRLDWPSTMTLFEIDQPAVINWKKNTLAKMGYRSAARHRYVGVDLRQNWIQGLRQQGFDASQPTAWIAEGLLVGYLPPSGQDEILDVITASSASGSRFAADYFALESDIVGHTLDNLHDLWRKHDPNLKLSSLTFPGARRDPSAYLAERGWLTHNADHIELFRAAGRADPADNEFPPGIESLRVLTAIRN